MPPSTGSKIKCPASTLQGKAQSGLLSRELLSHEPRSLHPSGRPGGAMRSDASKRRGRAAGKSARVRKHLVMCALRGKKLDFWKAQQVLWISALS